jgi:cytochrome c-type biogenesis protein CcmH
MIWIVFAAMTLGVTAFLLLPVLRRGAGDGEADRNAYDRAVFRDQLAELDRDLERGVIGPAEAEAARNEVSRRLIGAAERPPEKRSAVAPAVALLCVLLVPLVALPLYYKAGSPALPGVPLAPRLAEAEAKGDYEALIVKVEQHLASNPDDLEGWKVLAPAYARGFRFADSVEAHRNIVRLSPPDALNLANYAEAMVMAGQGMVSAEAHDIFGKALALDPKLPKARFFDALALKQEGKTEEAKAAFEAFLKDTPEDAPWRPMLLAEMQELGAKPPALDSETMASAQNMAPEDQQAMIRSMVDGLEEKLAANPDDLEGWLRLIRSRAVLGEAGKAKAAYDKALAHYSGNADALAQISALAKDMSLQ